MPAPSSTRIVTSIIPNSGIVGYAGGGAEVIVESATDGIVAHAGGTQAAAVPLTSVFNRVITVGTAGDSVVLPPAIVGTDIFVANAAGANSMNVFPASQAGGGVTGGDLINAGAQNAAFAMAAGKNAHFFCAVTGKWSAILSA